MIDKRLSDSQLVLLYQNGNEEAFEVLLLKHKSRIYTAIYLIVKDRYQAEDLLQETFIKAVNTIKGGRYNEEGKFLPWVSRIAHNLAIDSFRKSKRYPEAATAFKAAIRIKPDYVDAHYNLAVTYVLLKDRKGVLEEYNALKRLDPQRADEFARRFLK